MLHWDKNRYVIEFDTSPFLFASDTSIILIELADTCVCMMYFRHFKNIYYASLVSPFTFDIVVDILGLLFFGF